MLTLVLVWGCAETPEPSTSNAEPILAESAFAEAQVSPKVTFENGSTIVVEVVADPETRAQGLMYRPYLGEDRGMLFVFLEEGDHSFWMKNTLIPLDLLWLDGERRIVHVKENLQPCQADPCPSHAPGVQALYVLELSAGQAARRGVQVGHVLAFGGGIENIVPR